MPEVSGTRELGGHDIAREIPFWTRIMSEHALFIRLGLPNNRPDLVSRARSFEDMFGVLEEETRRGPLTPGLIDEVKRAAAALTDFKRELLRLQVECQLGGSMLYPLLIDHLIREAQYFLAILNSVPPGMHADRYVSVLREEVFWLRIMKEHPEFVMHLLDPSERMLLTTAEQFYSTFRGLLETARDLESMAESQPATFNTVNQFTDVVKANTAQLRDFKARGFELARLCRALSIVPTPVLLDHIRREADEFLRELEGLSKRLPGRGKVLRS